MTRMRIPYQPSRRRSTSVALGARATSLVLLLVVLTTCYPSDALSPRLDFQPNFVFIMTDDQDVQSLALMPAVQRELVRQGLTFDGSSSPLRSVVPPG